MGKVSSPPRELLDYCRRWSEKIVKFDPQKGRMAFFEDNLPALLQNQALITQILSDLSRGAIYGEHHGGMLFDNEVLLYMDRARRFSLRMYIHAPGDYTSVHDHSAWGVLGTAVGRLHVVKYRREDDGIRQNHAILRIGGERFLSPGETDLTLPLDEGIHKTGNASTDTLVVINVYGTPLRRLHINQFDPDTGQVVRVYPPRLHRKQLAAAALESLRNGSHTER
jgi:hypothetical protein